MRIFITETGNWGLEDIQTESLRHRGKASLGWVSFKQKFKIILHSAPSNIHSQGRDATNQLNSIIFIR